MRGALMQPKYDDDDDDDGVDEAEEGPNPSAGGPGVTIPGTGGKAKVRERGSGWQTRTQSVRASTQGVPLTTCLAALTWEP
jgi:hypothetical protein